MSSDALNGDANPPAIGRRVVAAVWAAAILPYLVLAVWVPLARAAGLFAIAPVPAVVVVSALVGPLLVATVPWIAAQLPASLDDWMDPKNRPLAALWGLGALLALVSLGRMAVFLGDPTYVSCSALPEMPFLVRHSCLTAYVHGAILSTDPAANVYDLAYVVVAPDAPLPATAARFAPFTLDAFGYPPPFLLLPRALLALTGDFGTHRIWFGAGSLSALLLSCAVAARTLGGLAERRIWLLTPLLMSTLTVTLNLQVGNFHLAALALCLLCWAMLERRRDHLAGALLAVATLAKIFPGLLGVVLLMQRRWRAVGATVAIAAALVALSVAVLGTHVWRDFLFYHLPKVQSGEALSFMADNPREVEFNQAPFGIPFKLAALGFANWGWAQARMFGNVYSVALLALAALASRNKGGPQHRLSAWLALVMLASLRSPYAAPFVLAAIQMIFLSLAAEVRSRRALVAFVAAWAIFSIPLPLSDPQVKMAASLVRIAAHLAFLTWIALRKERAEPAQPGT